MEQHDAPSCFLGKHMNEKKLWTQTKPMMGEKEDNFDHPRWEYRGWSMLSL